MRRAVKAVILRYLKSKYHGSDSVYYKPFCPYLVQPNPPNDDDRIDRQVDKCRDLMLRQPEAITTIAREYWAQGVTQEGLAEKHGLTKKRVAAVIGTIEHKVIKHCIEPETIRA